MGNSRTIVALSSGSLPSAIAIVRISGPDAFAVASAVGATDLKPRLASLRTLTNLNSEPIDQALVLAFPVPHSFTGEDVVEMHVHGSVAVVNALINQLCQFEHVGLASAGEFSQRALDADKLDVLAVEGLRDLLAAETEQQRKGAFRRYDGVLRRSIETWRDQLLDLAAGLEAQLDFSDEDDVSVFDGAVLSDGLMHLRQDWQNCLEQFEFGRRGREGVRIVLAGAPNSGKSSLLNMLTHSDMAIVSDEAGTTRDKLVARLNIGGVLVELIDVAGLRESAGEVEREGIRRARVAINEADLCLLLKSCDTEAAELGVDAPNSVLLINSKSDLGPVEGCDLSISVETGDGLDTLWNKLEELVGDMAGGDPPLISHLRDRDALEDCIMVSDRILSVISRVNANDHLELVGDDLRYIINRLDRLVGRIDVEDVLDNLFSGFCIGK